jgi:cytosine/adenosine deaminase-related metal-dependent hydrolase
MEFKIDKSSGSEHSIIALLGSVVHAIKFGELVVIQDGAVLYSSDGVIQKVADFAVDSRDEVLADVSKVIDYSGKILMPGFVDAHCHAPQVMSLHHLPPRNAAGFD